MTIKSNTRVTVDIPKADHRKLKMLAAHQGVSMREIFITLIERGLEEYQACPYSHKPNEGTLETIENIEKGKGLRKAASVDELFEKLSK
jgi:mRNA interferase YafQ